MSKQPIQAVVLPTEDITDIIIPTRGIGKGVPHLKEYYGSAHLDMGDKYQHTYITVSQDVEPIKEGDWFIKLRDVYPTGLGALHLCKQDRGNEKRTEKDWTLQVKYGNEEVLQKIIATTDPKLMMNQVEPYNMKHGYHKPVPQLQQSFLKEYCANPDREWEVEYEEYGLCIPCNKQGVRHCAHPEECGSSQVLNRLTLHQDNTVNITSVEEKMYSRKDMEEFGLWLGNNYKKNKNKFINILFDDWIKENL